MLLGSAVADCWVRRYWKGTFMFAIRLLIAACLASSLVTTRSLAAEEPDQASPAPDYPAPAAELVRKVVSDEAKIGELRSLYLRFEGKWTHTPLGIAKNRGAHERQFPGLEITAKQFQDLRPEIVEELEIAYDDRRVRKHAQWHDVSIVTRVWDGQRAVIYEKYFTHEQELFAFDARPERFVTGELLLDLAWQRMGPPQLLWLKGEITPEEQATHYGRAEDFRVVAQKEYRGRKCYVVENPNKRWRLWIDVDEGRLRGLAYLFAPSPKDELAYINRMTGRNFKSEAEAKAWFEQLSPEEQRPVIVRELQAQLEVSRPMTEFYLDDYRELAPGVWIPGRQGYVTFDADVTDADPSEVVRERALKLVEARANEPLPDALFEIELIDGVQVNDWAHDPPLFYKHKKDRTPEEWQAIVDEHERENAEWKQEQAARDALAGQPAFPFPKTRWLNSEPLDWNQLRGKVVLLHFWAHWCGPCHNDLPALSAWNQQASESPLVIIGVHAPGSALNDVEKDVADYNLGYPIVIDDSRANQPAAWGLLSHQYGVRGIPYVVVIDPQGKIAAHGRLDDVLPKAHELARKANDTK